jgi:phosphopantothenoylcysteine decarboxylase/phosphopantothenate--cysteine ligase
MRTITLVISGGIAAYKALELIRLLKKDGCRVVPVISKGGLEFVTPLSVSALAEEPAYSDLFSLTDETEMGHIRLSRISDLVVVAPASANMISKMAHGNADDLASTLLLATTTPVMVVPAMNPAMWAAPATAANIETLKKNGVEIFGPVSGDTACGEEGLGRMAEPAQILEAIRQHFRRSGPLAGKRAIVTAGPTVEAIDPVRFISNHSSGKQGYAIAEALMQAGADVTLVTGPVFIPTPATMRVVKVQTADEMLKAVEAHLPADIAVCAAAVADWKMETPSAQKMKKTDGVDRLELKLTRTPDILKTLSSHAKRPKLVIGFAAETGNLEQAAAAKLKSKGCDWLLANDVSNGVFGADDNAILFMDGGKPENWPRMAKADVAALVVKKIAAKR